ncbi:MAG: APC family permease [Myxococcota bacterium]
MQTRRAPIPHEAFRGPEEQGSAGATPSLRRVISLPWLILYGLGSTVGAGIYALTGIVAARAGFQAPLAFALAALLALCTGLSFAELSARLPRAGGALVYVRAGLRSSTLSLIVGLLSALSGIVSAATVSQGFVGYLSELVSIHPGIGLIIVIAGVGGLAAWGMRESVFAAGAITVVEIVGLIAIIGYGTAALGSQPFDASQLIPTELGNTEWVALMSATVLGFFAFLGFEDMVNVAEEVKDVRRNLPKAILWTLLISTVLYVAVTSVAVLMVPPHELGESSAPLALVFERSGGSGEVLAFIAIAAMLNGALVQIIMASRILFSLAREGPLPHWIGVVHPKRRTPVRATLIVTALVATFAALLPLDELAATTAAIALSVFTLVNISLFVLRLREGEGPDQFEPFVPIWVPALGAIFSFGLFLFEILPSA